MPLASRLKAAWALWKRVARALGNFQARVWLTLFYFVLVPPFALIVRLFSDPLALAAPTGDTYWVTRPASDASETTGRRQF